MKSVTADELLEQLEAGEEVHIIDVREDEEVMYGIIPGATHIPLGTVPVRTDELKADKPYTIICRSGVRSAQACAYLESEGFDVTNVEGGMLEWNGETIAK